MQLRASKATWAPQALARGAFLAGPLGVGAFALALGGAHVAMLLAVSPILIGAAALAIRSNRAPGTFGFRIALGLSAFSLLQAVPLPLWLVGVLSPQAADVWRGALHPF